MPAQTVARPAAGLDQPNPLGSLDSLDSGMLRILRARLELQYEFRIDQLTALRTMNEPADPPNPARDEIAESLAIGAETALRETGAAIRRLDEGTYGMCVECRRPLEVEQLAAVPQAARCFGCRRHRPEQ